MSRCKANPCCSDPHDCKVPLPQDRTGLYWLNKDEPVATNSPKNTIRQIDKVWMVVSVDPTDNTEGVCAVQVNGQWMPLLAADEERLPWIKDQMYRLFDTTGMSLRLIELNTRTVVEEHMQ